NHGEGEGLAMASRFGRALSTAYIEDASPAVAAADVAQLAALRTAEEVRPRLYRSPDGSEDAGKLRFKLFTMDRDLPLSDVLPMMENMGLRVIAEHLHRVHADERDLYIQDFQVEA